MTLCNTVVDDSDDTRVDRTPLPQGSCAKTPVFHIEPTLNWVYDREVRKWTNTETGEVSESSPSDCGEDNGEDYPQAQIVEGDTFTLSPQQIRAGIRLDIDETGNIRVCPSCGKRQVVIENGMAGQRRVCADAINEPATCEYKERI